MSEHYHDHEQDERDYYERSFTRRYEYAWFTIKLIVKLIIPMLLVAWLLFGCASPQPIATESVGTVIQVDGDRVLVSFKVVNKNYADQGVNWFYIPGHSYQEGDRYPDPEKDPSLMSGNSVSGIRHGGQATHGGEKRSHYYKDWFVGRTSLLAMTNRSIIN